MPTVSLPTHAKETIPPLAHDGYLPPLIGDPCRMTGRAPYPASVQEFVEKFKFSKWRCEVLTGFLTLRRKLFLAGIRSGFQWVDGSFAADIKPEPSDLDVVTFYHHPDQNYLIYNLGARGVDLSRLALILKLYHCDWYMVNMSNYPPDVLVVLSAYWYSLFSHTRGKQWKGLIQIRLIETADEAMREYRLQQSLLEGV